MSTLMIHQSVILLYSIAMEAVVGPLARVGAIFSDALNRQIHGRTITREGLLEMAKKRRLHKACVVFFCSSAGEYEQAKPLIDRFQRADVYTHVFFFSRSGFDFAKARHEESSYSLSPLDVVWLWGSLFSALRPNAIMIVRHEFWPAFLWAAAKWCKVYIIDAVPPAMLGREPKWKTKLSAISKRLMLSPDTVAYTVDASGSNYFKSNLLFAPAQIHECGDTKYDRVVERVATMRPPATKKAQDLRSHWNDPKAPILVVGSAHAPDMEVILPALQMLSQKIRLLVVPHDLSAKNLSRISDQIRAAKRSSELMSEVETQLLDGRRTEQNTIIVDSMGRLSELYAAGDLAWVGGAVHAKVHNVLEPAAWGLPLSCGPKYENSQEAKYLVDHDAIQTASAAKNAAEIWHRQLEHRQEYVDRLALILAKMCGASDLIANDFLSGQSSGGNRA